MKLKDIFLSGLIEPRVHLRNVYNRVIYITGR